jgi:hypothetical protein
MLSVQERDQESESGGPEKKTKKTKAMPLCGAAFVFSDFAAGRKLRVLRCDSPANWGVKKVE